MISQTAAKSLLSYECISDSLMVARFNCKHTKLTIVVCYAPTNSESRPDDISNKNAFYNQLDDLVSSIPKHDIQIVIGDLNAQVGNDTSSWKSVLGGHAEGALNDNGIRLLTFCLAQNLVVGTSLFPHKKIHKLTWNSPDGKTKNQIDHTLINRRWRNSLKDVRVYRGADVGSDHNLAITTVRLSLAALKKQKKQLKYNTANLLHRDILASFNATIGGKFQALAKLDEVSDVDEEWSNFSNTVNKAATEHLGHRKGKRDEWISTKSRDLIARRKTAKPALGSSYHEINRQTKASLRNDKKAWHTKIADELEEAATCNNMREVFQKKNILLGKTSKRTSQIRDENGDIIKDEAARLQRWAEYFKGLLNADEPDQTIDFSDYTVQEELDVNMEPPSREELDKAIALLKRNKAPG